MVDKSHVDLSIMVVNWNTRELLQACLSSVFRTALRAPGKTSPIFGAGACPPPVPPRGTSPRTTVLLGAHSIECEVIVVDNGSTDGSIEMVSECYPRVQLIQNQANVGFAGANNQGMRESTGRYFLLLNSDTEIVGDALDRMVGFMNSRPEVGAIGPRLIGQDGARQVSCDLFPLRPWDIACQRLLDLARPGNLLTRRARILRWTYDEPTEVDWVIGAALMVRRQVFELVGGLDEDYWMYAEEMDWCYRIKKAGWKVFYVPGACVYHFEGGSSQRSQELRRRLASQRDDSLVRFYRKHFGWHAAILMRLILARKRVSRQLSSSLAGEKQQ